MNKKIRMVVIIPLVILVAVFIAADFYVWRVWWPVKQLKIVQGLASFEFPWRDYSQAELNEMYPQIRNADVPTRVTPEETYAKFREALRTNDLELAVEQLAIESKSYEENKTTIEEAHKNGKFSEIYKKYPEKIQESLVGKSLSEYYFLEKKEDGNYRYSINFIKNANGDWKMDSL